MCNIRKTITRFNESNYIQDPSDTWRTASQIVEQINRVERPSDLPRLEDCLRHLYDIFKRNFRTYMPDNISPDDQIVCETMTYAQWVAYMESLGHTVNPEEFAVNGVLPNTPPPEPEKPLGPLNARRSRKLKRAMGIIEVYIDNFGTDKDKLIELYSRTLMGGIKNLRDRRSFTDRFRAARNDLYPRAVNPTHTSIIERAVQMMSGPPRDWPRKLDKEGQMVSVELEFVVPRERSGKKYTRPAIPGVSIVYDGSVTSHDTDNYYPGHGGYDSEARVTFQYGKWERLYRICKALTDMGCVANQSCGMHVHLDMRTYDIAYVQKVGRRLETALPLLNVCVPESRVNSDHARTYCSQRLRWGDSDRGRYSAINGCAYDRHGTLEVRLFAGSLNPTKIRHWIELLYWIAHENTRPRVDSLDSFINCKTAPMHLKEWVLARRAKLYPDTDGPVTDNDLEISEPVYRKPKDGTPAPTASEVINVASGLTATQALATAFSSAARRRAVADMERYLSDRGSGQVRVRRASRENPSPAQVGTAVPTTTPENPSVSENALTWVTPPGSIWVDEIALPTVTEDNV